MESKTISQIKRGKLFTIIMLAFLSISSCAQKKQAPKIDIHTAVLNGEIQTVKQHIAAKSDLNVKENSSGSTPLISAALFGKVEIAKLLIDAGALLNVQNNEGSTALITASFFCHPEIVKMLIAKNADKTIKNNYGSTAYDAVNAPFEEAKPFYDMTGAALAPLGVKLDYEYIKKTRPVIVAMLK
ncbi:MAG TPA: ankyrin repeat domain-containing protein [Ferruginibacter sp.]|nr:ankyrin repeat domain-containing protein [Ferruginibacter sp.]